MPDDRLDLFPYTKTPHFRILIILFLPRHSPISLNFSRYQTEIHRLPIPDITDHDRDTKTVTPAYRRIIDYTTYSLTAATLLFP